MSDLFSKYKIKNLELKNRIVLPPMCQYSVEKKDGIANEWHYNHYVSRAIGGTGLIIVEMTDVEPDGRISDYDLGLWCDEQIEPLKGIVDECHKYGAKMAIQIAHAGRKAEDAIDPVSSSVISLNNDNRIPRALETHEVYEMINKFKMSIERAIKAGFDTIELHGAHGYLIHQFHSKLINKREDEFGKDLTKFGVEIIKAAKEVMPKDMPLIMRISAREFAKGGYGLDYGVHLAKVYKEAGVDIIHVSSGGEGPMDENNKPSIYAGYQVPYAKEIKDKVNVDVIAVGILEDPKLANFVIESEQADLVAIGRGMFKSPYWPIEAALELNKKTDIPKQYERGIRFR